MEQVNALYSETKKAMDKALDHLEIELSRLRAGKASPQLLESISVEYFGTVSPINQVANVSVSDARTLSIQPWDKSLIAQIEKAIINSNIGLTPQNDGNSIRIFIPPLTEERRKELVKATQNEGEKARVAIRTVRKDSINTLKSLEKSANLSEDLIKDSTAEIQKITDGYILKVDKILQAKEKEVMTV